MDKAKRREISFLILCVIAGFALRFYTFDQKSLWIDEIHTFNDSRDNLKGQIEFYKQNPTYLHPPLFFVLTHFFYPFTKPERDLRIIPLIFGTLSIPMIYLFSRSFSPASAIPCTLSLSLMTYHISLSQDGRSYSFLLFLGIAGLYFLLKYLQTLKKQYLLFGAFLYAVQFHTSYSSLPFIFLSQILWFYRMREDGRRPGVSSIFLFNGLILLFSLPWVLFIAFHYRGQPFTQELRIGTSASLWTILYGILHDWVPHPPLMIASLILLVLYLFLAKYRENSIILLAVLVLPIGGVYLLCQGLDVTHFITSRYFINFLPLFLITLYLSTVAIEERFQGLEKVLRPKMLLLFLLVASNIIILPAYYKSGKQDVRGLVNYLKEHLREGDGIFASDLAYYPGLLHYFGVPAQKRHYSLSFSKDLGKEMEVKMSWLVYRNRTFPLYHSKTCCTQYISENRRLWIIVTGKGIAAKVKNESPFVLKGYFDGSFVNLFRFPTDASLYLFLWDPRSPEEKGIDLSLD